MYANKRAEAIHRRPLMAFESFLNHHGWQGFHADGRPYEPREWPLARSVHEGEVIEGEDIELLREDGTRVTVRAHSAPVRDAGRIIGAVVVYHDVSEQLRHEAFERSARAEAEAANRAKDEFLAMLGHELRNPLQALATSVALLHPAPQQEDKSSRSLQIIDRQTRLLTRLVNDLLDVTRATTGKIRLERESVNLNGTLEHCLEQLAHAGRLEHHAIELQSESVWGSTAIRCGSNRWS